MPFNRITILLLCCLFLVSCGGNGTEAVADSLDNEEPEIDSVVTKSITLYCDRGRLSEIMYRNHVITGQPACFEIAGRFDGVHQDTVYIEMEDGEDIYNPRYYLVSKSGRLPKLEIWGCYLMAPLIYKEGDLDGNGTDEIGHLHTWGNSQWRDYRIYTLVDGEWRFLVKGECLSTPQWFRHAGVEIAEPGKEKGTVLIHYSYEGYDEKIGERVAEVRDTIVVPSFIIIDDYFIPF